MKIPGKNTKNPLTQISVNINYLINKVKSRFSGGKYSFLSALKHALSPILLASLVISVLFVVIISIDFNSLGLKAELIQVISNVSPGSLFGVIVASVFLFGVVFLYFLFTSGYVFIELHCLDLGVEAPQIARRFAYMELAMALLIALVLSLIPYFIKQASVGGFAYLSLLFVIGLTRAIVISVFLKKNLNFIGTLLLSLFRCFLSLLPLFLLIILSPVQYSNSNALIITVNLAGILGFYYFPSLIYLVPRMGKQHNLFISLLYLVSIYCFITLTLYLIFEGSWGKLLGMEDTRVSVINIAQSSVSESQLMQLGFVRGEMLADEKDYKQATYFSFDNNQMWAISQGLIRLRINGYGFLVSNPCADQALFINDQNIPLSIVSIHPEKLLCQLYQDKLRKELKQLKGSEPKRRSDILFALALSQLIEHGVNKQGSDTIMHNMKLSAEDGNKDAMFYLGYAYQGVFFPAKNEALSLKWFQQAARQGHLGAMSWLINYYENKKVNLVLAYYWAWKGAAQGGGQYMHDSLHLIKPLLSKEDLIKAKRLITDE